MAVVKNFQWLLLLSLMACGARFKKNLGLPPSANIGLGQKMRGTFLNTDGSRFSLEDDQNRPTVLVFANEFCGICQDENEHFRDSLSDPSQAPANINLHTVMVGGDETVATQWKTDYQLPWRVGADPDLELFTEYCPENVTPCTIVHLPGRGIVLRQVNEITRAEIEIHTGPWE